MISKKASVAFEKQEQVIELRSKVLQAEQERLNGSKTMSVSEAKKELKKRAEEM